MESNSVCNHTSDLFNHEYDYYCYCIVKVQDLYQKTV